MTYRLTLQADLIDHDPPVVRDGRTGQAVTLSPDELAIFRALCNGPAEAEALAEALGGDPGEALSRLVESGLVAEAGGAAPEPPLLIPAGQTMFGCPARTLDRIEAGEIVFFGVPTDQGATGFPGARFGPNAIRAASGERHSYVLDPETLTMQGWSEGGPPMLKGARMADLGNVVVTLGEDPAAIYERIGAVSAAVFAAGAFPVVLGGDHSITFATVPTQPYELVHIDAHSDFAPWDPARVHHHGSVLTRLVVEKPLIGLHQIGQRVAEPLSETPQGLTRVPQGPLPADWLERIRGAPTYLTLDIDVLTPAEAPGTGTPVPGGLSVTELAEMLRTIATVSAPVGFELVEVNPMQDAAGLTERAAVALIVAFLGAWHAGR